MTAGAEFLLALACYGAAALLALFRSRRADVLGALLAAAGSISGLAAAGAAILSSEPLPVISAAWPVPGGQWLLSIDSLSGAFLVVVFAIAGAGSIYGLAYWPREEHPRTASRLRFFYALMTVAMSVVFTARNALLFLLAWETMAVSAFLLVATEDESEEVRRASWNYLVATHIGTLFLFAAFTVLRLETGSYTLSPGLASTAGASLAFLLALCGFGFKAGLVPLHFWLPPAHANAPSHVSALMSGVMLKAGIYGILRISSLVSIPPLWWSFVLMSVAAVTAVTGIALAFAQTELKKALAYSSVENMGIVCLGISLALAGRSLGQPAWVALGLGGAVIHVWSHAAFKSLLFFASGGVLHGTHNRSMEQMGGLLRRMPVTGLTFAAGALAAAGMPLLNGFIGEWLIALGFFHAICSSVPAGGFLALAAPALALAGALALASFLRILGVVFLGSPRSAGAEDTHEASSLMLAPLVLLAIVCVALGLWPGLLSRPVASILASWSPESAWMVPRLLSFPYTTFAAVFLLALAPAAVLLAKSRRSAGTWDCGYAAPTVRMQYTASSAGEWLTSRLLPRKLRPEFTAMLLKGLFPGSAQFGTRAADPFSSRIYEPLVSRWSARFQRLRWLQQGRLTLYLVYIFLATLGGLAWAIIRSYLK